VRDGLRRFYGHGDSDLGVFRGFCFVISMVMYLRPIFLQKRKMREGAREVVGQKNFLLEWSKESIYLFSLEFSFGLPFSLLSPPCTNIKQPRPGNFLFY